MSDRNHPRRPSRHTVPEWPRHADGSPMKMGEMTIEQQDEQAAYAIRRLQPEFAAQGVALSFRKAVR